MREFVALVKTLNNLTINESDLDVCYCLKHKHIIHIPWITLVL